jgi:hypothetical protein
LNIHDRPEILEFELNVKLRITSLDIGFKIPDTSAEPEMIPRLPGYVRIDLDHRAIDGIEFNGKPDGLESKCQRWRDRIGA